MEKQRIRERFAVMNNAYRRFPFAYFLDSMERLGLRWIDLWGGWPHLYAPEMTDRKLAQLRREMESRGLEVAAYTPEVLAYPYDLAAEDARLRRRSVEYMKLNLEIADALGSPLMLVGPGFCPWDTPREEAFQRLEDSLAELLEYGAAMSVGIAVEHLTTASSNLVNRPGDLARILRGLEKQPGAGHLGCVLDLGQMSIFGDTVPGYFEVLGEKIWIVHMMDGNPELHLAFGDGILPMETYYHQVNLAGYRGTITLEINDRRYLPEPHLAISRCVAAMEEWQEVG